MQEKKTRENTFGGKIDQVHYFLYVYANARNFKLKINDFEVNNVDL